MTVAALIADLVNAGVDAALIGRVAEAIASREAVLIPDEQAQRRRERDRERARVRRNPQTSAESADPPAPPETKSAPTPPEKTQTPPYPPDSEAIASVPGRCATPAVSKADIEGIWAEAPRIARERSSRSDVRRALKAAAERGHSPPTVRSALGAYWASDQASRDDRRACKGVHRMIEADRWQDWIPQSGPNLQVVRTPEEQAAYDAKMAVYLEGQIAAHNERKRLNA